MPFKYILLVVILVWVPHECSKLNLPRVLLPIFQSFSTNFTLEVTGIGCYKWSSSRLDIVLVKPIDENIQKGCSQKAVVSSVARESVRNMAIVLAEEVVTGQVFRADVIVDVISSLNIVTTTRELYMEEPPEMFEVRAYDVEGNEFTTLEGVELQWSLIGGGRSKSQVLRFMSFRESTYETPPSIASFDSQGKQGHIVLLEGIRTGFTKVSVQLPHPEYRNVPHVEVSLTVIANLIIDPSDSYILKGDIINFRIMQVRQGRLVEVKMGSSSQYSLVPEDRSIVKVTSDSLTGLALGRTKLTLHDSNAASEQEKFPTAYVTVVQPDYISLAILPFNNWSLFTNQRATLITEVFDRENHKLVLGVNTRVLMRVDETIFTVVDSSQNGSVAWGGAITAGVSDVTSALYSPGSVPSPYEKPLLKASATLHVFSPLILSPAVVAFPFHHSAKSEVAMAAEGGDGVYIWDTLDHNVAVVSQSGVLKPTGEGETRVQVSMVRNQHLKAHSIVHILKPESIEILGGVHEAEVNSHIFLDVALYGLTKDNIRVPFSDCSQIKFIVSVDSNFFYDPNLKRDPVSRACAVIGLVAKKENKSKVTIGFPTDIGVIEGNTMVASFKPLVAVHPPEGKAVVLAVGSSRHIVVSGGPKPWFGKVVASYASDSSLIRANTLLERQEQYAFNILCTKLGQADFIVTTATDPYIPNCKSVRSQVKIPIICAKPKHLELGVSMGPECPLTGSDQSLVTCNSKFRVNIFVKDIEGRTFDNATSLTFKWIVGKEPLFSIEEPNLINLNADVKTDYILPLNHFKDLMTKSNTGGVVVKLRVVGYHQALLSELSITVPTLDSRAEGSLMVRIVESVSAEPSNLSVINQPLSRAEISLLHGSGYFSISSTPDHIVIFHYDSSLRKVIISPRVDGYTVLRIEDHCLPITSLSIQIQVVNIGSIRVEVESRLEKSRQGIAVVRLYDAGDRPLVGDLSEVSLEATTQGVVSIKMDEANPLKFTVVGTQVGRTSLIATWNNVTSPPAPLQVFTAIRILPRNVTLIVGTEYQVKVAGGPGPDLHFTVVDSSVATITNTGLLNALHIGETWVNAAALGSSGEVVSKDTVVVTVIPLSGVRISSPTSVLCVGCSAPLWASPLPSSLGPLVLGSVLPPLSFSWSLSLPGVAQICDRFSKSSIQMRDEDRLSVEVKGLKAGRTVVHIVVTGGGMVHQATLELDIVDELAFTSPPGHPNLLVAPNTHFQVTTKLDNVKYQVVGVVEGENAEDPHAVSRASVVLTMNPDGSATSHSTGHALILARAQHPTTFHQFTALPIQVKPVHYMMMNIVSRLNSTEVLDSLPQGLQLNINVTYHDCLGRVFFASPSSIQVKVNRNDRIHISHGPVNNSLTLSLESSGASVLHLQDPISSLSHDFLRIPVESYIQPLRKYMTVGEVVCFSSRVNPLLGSWSSDNDVVVIEKRGMAKAMKTGSVTLTYTLDKPHSHIVATSTLDVLPLYGLQFGKGNELAITNHEVGMEYVVPVQLLNERTKRELPSPCLDSPYEPHIFPFSCEIRFNSLSVAHSVSSVFSVHPTFNKKLGSYGCLIRVEAGPSANISMVQSNVTMRVAQVDRYMVDRPLTDSLVIAFHPAIHVTLPEVRLQPPSSTAYLVLIATPQLISQVIVEASDSSVLTLGRRETRSSSSYAWPIVMQSEYWGQYERQKDLAVHIISHLTNQRIKVPVITVASGQTGCVFIPKNEWALFDNIPSIHNSIFIAFIAIAVFFLASNYCYIQWNRPVSSSGSSTSSSPRVLGGREFAHTSLQEAALGRRASTSPYSSQKTVYGSPVILDNSSPRLRKLYQ